MDDTEKDLTSSRYRNAISHCRYFVGDKVADVREKIAKAIEKTNESIRKKYCALKIGRIDEGIALNRHFNRYFKPVISPTASARARQ